MCTVLFVTKKHFIRIIVETMVRLHVTYLTNNFIAFCEVLVEFDTFTIFVLLEETWKKPLICSTKLLTWPNRKWRWLIYTHSVTLPTPRQKLQRNMD